MAPGSMVGACLGLLAPHGSHSQPLLPVWCGPRLKLTHPLRMNGERRCGKGDPITVRPFGDRHILSCIVAALMNSHAGPSGGNFFEPRSRWRKGCSSRAPACTCYAAFVEHLRNARRCSSLSMTHTRTPARALFRQEDEIRR